MHGHHRLRAAPLRQVEGRPGGPRRPRRRAHRAQAVPQQRQHVRHSPESHPGAGAPQVGKLLRNEHQGRDGGLGLRRPDQLDGKHRRQEVERAGEGETVQDSGQETGAPAQGRVLSPVEHRRRREHRGEDDQEEHRGAAGEGAREGQRRVVGAGGDVPEEAVDNAVQQGRDGGVEHRGEAAQIVGFAQSRPGAPDAQVAVQFKFRYQAEVQDRQGRIFAKLHKFVE